MITKIKPHVHIYQHDEYLRNNTIVIEQAEQLIIIDPSFNFEAILKDYKYQQLCIVLTHCHNDHTGHDFMRVVDAADVIIASIGSQQLLNNQYFNQLFFTPDFKHEAPTKWQFVDDQAELAGMTFILTPGHSVDSMCIAYEDLLITGDCLFAQDIGRTDFPCSNPNHMHKSLIKLNNYLKKSSIKWVIPGHEEWISKKEILATHQWLLALK